MTFSELNKVSGLDREGKRGQAYNLNLAGCDILAPYGRYNWHHCRECSSSPNSNRVFWDRKRETNMARDRHVTRQLRGRGWKVIRIWQHSLQKSPRLCISRIRRMLPRLILKPRANA